MRFILISNTLIISISCRIWICYILIRIWNRLILIDNSLILVFVRLIWICNLIYILKAVSCSIGDTSILPGTKVILIKCATFINPYVYCFQNFYLNVTFHWVPYCDKTFTVDQTGS